MKGLKLLITICLGLALFTGWAAASDGTPDYWKLAEQAYNDRKFAEAKPLYLAFYDERGTINDTQDQQRLNALCLLRIGQCCVAIGDYTDGRTWAQRVISSYPSDTGSGSSAQYEIGVAYLREGSLSSAMQAFGEVITSYPTERHMGAKALRQQASIRMRQSLNGEAVQMLRALLSDYSEERPICADSKWLLVEALNKSDQLDAALSLFDDMTQSMEYTRVEKLRILYAKARMQREAGRTAAAVVTLRGALRDYEDDRVVSREVKLALAQALNEDKKFEEALAMLEEMRQDSELSRSQKEQVELLTAEDQWRIGRLDEANKTIADILKEYSNLRDVCTQAKLSSIEGMSENDRRDEALTAIDALTKEPVYSQAEKAQIMLCAARIKFRSGKNKEARELLEVLTSDSPKWPLSGPAKILMCQVMCSTRDTEGLKSLGTEILHSDRFTRADKAMVTLWMAGAYEYSGDRVQAEQWMSKVIDDYGDTNAAAEAYFHRGRIRTENGDYEAALPDIEKIPWPYLQRYQKGEWLYVQGRRPEARAEFEQVIPSLPPYRVSRCEIFLTCWRMYFIHKELGDTEQMEHWNNLYLYYGFKY